MRFDPRRYRLRHRGRPLDVWAAGEGPPVALIHGWGLSGRVFRRTLRALAARGYHAVAPSVSVSEDGWSLETAARLALEGFAAVDVMRAPVVGHSLGGAVGVRLAVDHPDFVSALVLADSPVVSHERRSLVRLALPGPHYRVAAHASTAAALLGTVAGRRGPSSLAAAVRWILTSDLEHELQTLRDWRLPSAVLWAANDTLLPPSIGERTAEALGATFRLVTAEDGWTDNRPPDHDWPMRAPAFFARLVLEALREILPD